MQLIHVENLKDISLVTAIRLSLNHSCCIRCFNGRARNIGATILINKSCSLSRRSIAQQHRAVRKWETMILIRQNSRCANLKSQCWGSLSGSAPETLHVEMKCRHLGSVHSFIYQIEVSLRNEKFSSLKHWVEATVARAALSHSTPSVVFVRSSWVEVFFRSQGFLSEQRRRKYKYF